MCTGWIFHEEKWFGERRGMGIGKQNANGISAGTFSKINKMTDREGNVWRHRLGK